MFTKNARSTPVRPPRRSRRPRSRFRLAAWASFAALLIVVTGCGGSGSSGSDSGGKGQGAAQAQAEVEKLYTGTQHAPPTEGPKAQTGKNVWVISCGQVSESCVVPTTAHLDAGKHLGWKMTAFDGKFDPNQYNAGIQQAIADKADGIILISVDCQFVRASLKQAEAAGIKVIGNLVIDCDDPKVNQGAGGLSAKVPVQGSTHTSEIVGKWAAAKADWAIAKLGGKVKAITLREPATPIFDIHRQAFEERLKERCSSCEVVEAVNYSTAKDYGGGLQQKIQQALLQHPEANLIVPNWDSDVTGGVGPAVQASGRAGKLEIIGAEGYPGNLKLLSEGKQETASMGWNQEFLAWSINDALNRVFAGEQPVDGGSGWYLIDKDHNMPPLDKPAPARVDFQSQFKKLWGAG
jgi:ribose transport system substrate-binding protein